MLRSCTALGIGRSAAKYDNYSHIYNAPTSCNMQQHNIASLNASTALRKTGVGKLWPAGQI